MTIETKYNIGDEVWLMCENKARQSYIVDIRAKCEKEDAENPFNDCPHPLIVKDEITIEVFYWVKRLACAEKADWLYREQELFPTKEELLKSL